MQQEIHPAAAAWLQECDTVERHGPMGGNYVDSREGVYLRDESSAAREDFYNQVLPDAGVQVMDNRQDVITMFGKERLLAQHAEYQMQQAEQADVAQQQTQKQSTGPSMG